MITDFIISIFKLPKRIWNWLKKAFKKIKETLRKLFVPKKKKRPPAKRK